jgi:carboxypeptidase Taq
VRITTRYKRDYLPASFFGTVHETGHGLYEQGVDAAYTRTTLATDLIGLYAVGGTSFGAHESQSRLWENHVARSRTFWQLHFAELQRHFPEQLADVDAEAFYRAVTRIEPGLIRVEADELTYDFHIMLRVDLECALMDGSLKAADLPEAWNAAIRRDLGLQVPDDARGVLQDVHWSTGYIGSFPTYTIGNVMAAQLMETLRHKDRDLDAALQAGRYEVLAEKLRDAVWQHGRRFTRDELLARTTGRALDPEPYLRYLARKYAG